MFRDMQCENTVLTNSDIEGEYVCLNEDVIPVRWDIRKPRFRDRKKMATESISELEIPIWVKGTQKWVTGLTKRTTCDDVIYALLYQDGKHDQVHTSAYAIFEKWREVERPLQGRTKIVKVWRAWGAEQGNVHLSMRKIDELEYSGEFSLTRRKKRSRHRTRDRDRERERDRERHGREHRRHHAYCQNTSERLRSMESVVKLVISQERKLKDVIEHISDTDKLIEKYESRLHNERLLQNGEEYVQDSYLESRSTDSMDDFFERVNAEELEMYVDYCDRIIALEERIAGEHAKIEELSFQIQQSIQNSGDENLKSAGDELTHVQVELNRAVTCAIMQQYKCQDLQRELQFYDEKLKSRDELCKRLEQELNECDPQEIVSHEGSEKNEAFQCELNDDTLDHLKVRSDSVERLDGESSVERDIRNPLPIPERSNRTKLTNSTKPPPIPERKPPLPPERPPRKINNQNSNCKDTHLQNHASKEQITGRKPILKQSSYDYYRNGYSEPPKSNGETKVRFKTDSSLVDKYYWEESSSEGISIDQSDCSDSKDLFECVMKREKDNYALYKPGIADKPYLTVKVEDNDSNSDTGLSSMHSDDSAVYHLETLV